MQPAAGQLLSYISLHDETQKGENSCLCVHGYSISIFLSARLMEVLTGSHSARFFCQFPCNCACMLLIVW